MFKSTNLLTQSTKNFEGLLRDHENGAQGHSHSIVYGDLEKKVKNEIRRFFCLLVSV